MRSGQPAVWRIDTYRDTREAQVIEELSGSETVQCIAEEIVGPLRAHDAASGMDLLDTPVTFIKCNCNVYPPNIPAYRLEKSESVTGMSLKDP